MEPIRNEISLGKFAPHEMLIEAEDNEPYWKVMLRRITKEEIDSWLHKATPYWKVMLRRITKEEIDSWLHKATAEDSRMCGSECSSAGPPEIPGSPPESRQ